VTLFRNDAFSHSYLINASQPRSTR